MGLRSDDCYRVLVVDGDTETRGMTATAIAARPHFEVVGEACDGVAGVRLAAELEPDLVVFDPSAADGDGVAAMRELAASAPDADVVVYSDAMQHEDAMRAAGASAWVHKAGDVSTLVEALNAVAVVRCGRGAAEVLDDTEELRRLVFESMNEGVVVQDQAGRIVFSNTAAQGILQRNPEWLHGRTSMDPEWDSVHPDGSPWPGKEHPAAEAMRTQTAVTDVLMGVRRGDGERFWVSVTAAPVSSRTGTPLGVVVTFVDVTDRQVAHVAQLSSDERFRSAVDSMLDGFMIMRAVRDDDQIVDFVYEFVNAAVEKHAGYTPEELLGRRLLDVAPDLVASGAFQRYADAVETGVPIVLEVPWSGGPRVQGAFEVRAVRVGDGLAITFRNITERKLNEAAARSHPVAAGPDHPGATRPVVGMAETTLTAREHEVLVLLGEGVSTREISERLFISLNTSRNHVQRVIAKLGAHSRLEAVAIARRSALLPGNARRA